MQIFKITTSSEHFWAVRLPKWLGRMFELSLTDWLVGYVVPWAAVAALPIFAAAVYFG